MNDIHTQVTIATLGICAVAIIYNVVMQTGAQIRIDNLQKYLFSNRDVRERMCDTAKRDIQALKSIRFNHILNMCFALLVVILQLINISLP